ncbi:hypothetical protein R5R35_009732 [Gryllus longicercus]|uniref:Papillote n=1 Tax=Gryllus longicercus TaxID=2509291 RepID=A0AAN9WG43_9ORTH
MRGVAQLSLLALVVALAAVGARAQSNYASHANNIEYQGEGLPEEATLDGRVTRLDDLSPIIALNRTRAALNCAAGSMQVELKFKQPFFGLAYADFDRNSACQLAGNGDITYTLELPLKGCGTKQDPQRVFTNNIVVRFHPGLEMDGDEIITIVCRYPPPVAPPPAALPSAILTEPVAPSVIEPPLKGFHILLIICAILFLSLLLLGLSCSYVCLKKRNIRVVRRAPFSGAGTGTGSEITKLSGSSLGNLSLFEGLRIPRAHAPPAASVSGSEAQLILAGGSHSDTLPSDYPSESPSSVHSEVEDVDTRSLRRPSTVSSAGSYDNKAFLHQEALASFYAEGYAQRAEAEVVAPPPPPEPRFDVSVRVKKAAAPPPPPTPPPSDVESTMSVQARNLTTILEREERRAPPPPPPQPQATTFSYAPELHPPPAGSAAAAAAARYAQTPPVYSRILRRQHEHVQTREALDSLSERSIPDNDNWSQAEDVVDAPQRHLALTPARSLTSLNTEMTDTRSMSEIVDTSHQRYTASLAPPPPPPPPIAPASYTTHVHVAESADLLEPPVVAERRPEITTHIVDDVFLKTITEKRTVEDVERHRRQVTEYHARPQPAPNPKWDVVIRNYPDPNAPPPAAGSEPGPDWESYSEASSVSGVPTTPIAERHRVEMERSYLTTLDVPAQQPAPPNWDVLIRVLNPPDETVAVAPTPGEPHRAEALLTVEDREKWRQIITTESTLRTLLTEATVREDFERIRHDQRYERLFEPHKWDVIIRVLAPPDRPSYSQRDAGGGGARYRRKADWDTRSRRSSLPTLYEYDSDGGSSVRTLVAEGAGAGGPGGAGGAGGPPARSRRTSRSSLRSDMDVRSMTEVTVDFARSERADTLSDASAPSSYRGARRFHDGYGSASDDDEDGGGGGGGGGGGAGGRAASLVRSASQPSLARSASEFTEHWAAPGGRGGRWDGGDLSSPELSPRSQRSSVSQVHQQMQQQLQQQIQQRLAAAPPPAPGVARELVITATTSAVRETYEQGWFGDGDSEASFK